MNLKELFDDDGCDKSHRHSYHEVYEPHFEPLRNEKINILEIGIFEGLSTSAFLDYFPNATIYGVDIFTRLNPEDVPVLEHERVKWAKGDSTIMKELPWEDVKFDIIIDDGKHTPEANKLTFENMFPYLKEDGMYFIEDVHPLDIMSDKDWEFHWLRDNPNDFNMEKMNEFLDVVNQYKTARYDLRENNVLDSYIFKVER